MFARKFPRFSANLEFLLTNWTLRILLKMRARNFHRRNSVDGSLRRRCGTLSVVLGYLFDEFVESRSQEIVARVHGAREREWEWAWAGAVVNVVNGQEGVGLVIGLEYDPRARAGVWGFRDGFGFGLAAA